MLRCVYGTAVVLALIASAPAGPLKLKTLQVGGRVYRDVTVLGANTTDIYFTHAEGIANVKLKYLNEQLQKRFNYDAQAATEAERQQAEDDARYQAALAEELAARARKAMRDAKNAALTSDLNLADPISDKSLLGKPAPSLPTRWVGGKPELADKFVLTFVWTPWSVPCRKQIPELNALQRRFAGKLAVVGVTTEPEEDVRAMEEPVMEFASALDPEAKLISAAAITSIPQALLTNPKGIVIFQGHPAVLNTNNVSALIQAFEGETAEREEER
jgi:cytochrome c biogenesis protein CcmG/thiol:disulfide interchange protein DsbE